MTNLDEKLKIVQEILILRRKYFEQVHGFDERFFFCNINVEIQNNNVLV